MTERFRRKDFGHMQLEITFNDPKAYTKPWTIAVGVNFVPDTELLEFVCNENEKDRGRLVGAVQDEKKAEVRVSPDTLSKYVGTYRMGPLGDFRVSVDQGQLMIELPGGGGREPLFAQSDKDFVFPTLGGLVGVRHWPRRNHHAHAVEDCRRRATSRPGQRRRRAIKKPSKPEVPPAPP